MQDRAGPTIILPPFGNTAPGCIRQRRGDGKAGFTAVIDVSPAWLRAGRTPLAGYHRGALFRAAGSARSTD